MTKIQEIAKLGQSIWIDYIRRSFITSGDLEKMIDEGLLGLTSNPTIFDKAIAGSEDYDDELQKLVQQGKTIQEIYEALVLKDIGNAADLFRPIYNETDGKDGFVSLEVSPQLAYDTDGTITEAKRLFAALNRPNVMIKVPATEAGLPAIASLIGLGINVNVTLIFGVENYRQVAEAYLSGLENLANNGPGVQGGLAVEKVASVASFFVSRVDTAVDKALEEKGNQVLQGKIAIANSRVAYQAFQEIFSGARWKDLESQGARKQRVLFGSTSSKNPAYPDTLYVDELIGPETVNTVPPQTYADFKEKGTVRETLTSDVAQAKEQIEQLAEIGINLDTITTKLQRDGVDSFAKSFESMMESIQQKKKQLEKGKKNFAAKLGDLQSDVDKTLKQMEQEKIVSRIWDHDHTVWGQEPTEITNRLGWLKSPETMLELVPDLQDFVNNVRGDGFKDALLLGMGGSSLAPEVFRKTLGVQDGYLDLHVLDSTDPGAVLEYAEKLNPKTTLYIVSTKSGGTVETLSFMKYFYNQTKDQLGEKAVGNHFVAITDPGSKLEELAKNLNFRKTFLNDPNIGGRYSALSYFGVVPAALIGVDLNLLFDKAQTMMCNCESCNTPVDGKNAGAWLGGVMGELANKGKDKLTFIISPKFAYFGSWVEQLIAESTGKDGKGILPVEGEALLDPKNYAKDRLFVYLRLEGDHKFDSPVEKLEDAGFPVVKIHLDDLYNLGSEIFRWEIATAVAGWRLNINPFDQPNVESAKVQARKMVTAYQEEGKLPELKPTLEEEGIAVFTDTEAGSLADVLENFLSQGTDGKNGFHGRSYINLQAYVKPTPQTDVALKSLRTKLQQKYRMATTVGYGPRFLHSTGQLHKGDGGNGLFIQFTSEMPNDIAVPDEPGKDASSISFGVLKSAQALGDRQALLDEGRKVIRFRLGANVAEDLNKLMETVA